MAKAGIKIENVHLSFGKTKVLKRSTLRSDLENSSPSWGLRVQENPRYFGPSQVSDRRRKGGF